MENTEDILTLSILMDLTKSLIFNSAQPLGQIAPLHSYISKENGASIIYKILKNYIDSFCLVFKENQVADYFISSISGYQLLTSVFRTIHPICISKKALNKEIFTQIFTDIKSAVDTKLTYTKENHIFYLNLLLIEAEDYTTKVMDI